MPDLIISLIILFFVLMGLRKGFWRYLIEILITVIAFLLGLYAYQITQEILKAFLFALWVFLCLSLLRWFQLKVWSKRIPQHLSVSPLTRLWGALLGFIWGIFFAVLLLLSIELLPEEAVFNLKYNIKQNLLTSRTCRLLYRIIPVKEMQIIENISFITRVSLNEKAKIRLLQQPKAQELLEYEPFKEVMRDPQTVKQILNNDMRGLLRNPKIIQLINDGKFVEELFKLDFQKALGE